MNGFTPRRRRQRRQWLVLTTATAISAGFVLYGVLRACEDTHPAQRTAGSASSNPPSISPTLGVDWSWSDFHGVRLPSSPTDGPRDTHADLALGFTDTPSGGLLAAVNIAMRANLPAGQSIFEPTITRQMIGDGAATLLAALRLLDERQHHPQPGDSGPQQYASVLSGYRWLSYSPQEADVEVATADPIDGHYLASTRLHLTWLAGDWKLAAPPGGRWSQTNKPLASLDGYTSFPTGA